MTAGINPKKRPVILSRIERVSKNKPNESSHGFNIKAIPIRPMIIPKSMLFRCVFIFVLEKRIS